MCVDEVRDGLPLQMSCESVVRDSYGSVGTEKRRSRLALTLNFAAKRVGYELSKFFANELDLEFRHALLQMQFR